MRIAFSFYSFEPNVNGVVTIYKRVLDRLASLGHDLLLFVPPRSSDTHPSGDVVVCPGFPLPGVDGYQVPFAPPDLEARLERFRPDVVHVVDPWVLNPLGNVMLAVAGRLGIPRLVAYHTHHASYAPAHGVHLPFELLERLEVEQCARSELIIAPSRSAQTELERGGIPKVGLWRAGVDLRVFDPARRSPSLRARLLGDTPRRRLLVAVGRLAPEKNFGALCRLVRDREDWVLALAGEGPERQRLTKLLPPDRGHLMGALDPVSLASLYASSDLHVVTSTTETQGLTVLESLACGTPVVAAHAGGLPEAIIEGVNGETVPPNHDSMLVAAIDRWSTPTVATRAACRSTAVTWDGDHEVDQLLGHYARACELAAIGPAPRRPASPLVRMLARFSDWANVSVPIDVHAAFWKRVLGPHDQ